MSKVQVHPVIPTSDVTSVPMMQCDSGLSNHVQSRSGVFQWPIKKEPSASITSLTIKEKLRELCNPKKDVSVKEEAVQRIPPRSSSVFTPPPTVKPITTVTSHLTVRSKHSNFHAEPKPPVILQPKPIPSPPENTFYNRAVHSPQTSDSASDKESEGSSKPGLTTILPPCRVCGDKATGFHYGANTCEACKGFFRRSLSKGHTYTCANSKQCPIDRSQKSCCPYCRLQRCLAMGMSRSGIRRGRYTLEKKTRCIKEVKWLERQQKLQQCQQTQNVKREDFEQLIGHLREIHSKYCSFTEELVQSIPQRHSEFLEQRKRQESLFGPIPRLDRKTYKELYDITGLDVDGRKQLIQNIIPHMEEGIRRFVNFTKCIPGFKDLPVDDQTALVKTNQYYWRVLHIHYGVNVEDKIFTSSTGLTSCKDDFAKLVDEEYAEVFFKTAALIKNLQPTDEEVVLLKVICILATDQCPELKCREKIEKMHDHFVELLQYYEESQTPGSLTRLAQLLLILPTLREGDVIHRKMRESLFSTWSDLELPQLVWELL